MSIRLLWLLLLGWSTALSAQRQELDSLLQALPQLPQDTQQLATYQRIADLYLTIALDSAESFAQKSLTLARQLQHTRAETRSLNILGNYYERKTQYDQAAKYYQQALAIVEQNPSPEGFAIVLNNLAILRMRKGDYKGALEDLFKALAYEEEVGNQRGIAEAYNNIGVVYYYQRNVPKTLEYFEKSIQIEEQLDQPDILKKGYNNLGALYDYQKNYNKALEYYLKSYALSQRLEDQQEMALNLNNIATAHLGLGNLDTAQVYLEQSILMREQLGDFRGVSYSYYNFAILLKDRKRYDEALAYFERTRKIAVDNQLPAIQSELYKGRAQLEEHRNDYQAANEYWKQYIAAQDTLLNAESAKAIAEIESKYEVAKKEKALLEQQLLLDQQALDIEQKNNQLLLLGGTALLFLLLSGFAVYYLRQRNQQLQRERALESAKATIATQEQLEQQRFRISRDLHDNIGAQLTFIISSLENLPYRFELLPALTERLQHIGGFTRQTIQELRDTIWVMNKGSLTLGDLQSRIQQFVHQAQGAQPETHFEVVIDPALEALPALPATQGMHLYRLLQEATNNALKHAEASRLTIQLRQQGDALLLAVEDNGKGFDSSQRLNWNNGLHHLHQRAEELGGRCSIESALGQGTAVQVTIPMHRFEGALALVT